MGYIKQEQPQEDFSFCGPVRHGTTVDHVSSAAAAAGRQLIMSLQQQPLQRWI